MNKKRKIRYDRLILLVLIALVLIAIIVMGIIKITQSIDSNDKNTITPTDEIIESDDISIELVSYKTYLDIDNTLGFNFVVAELKFSSNEAISYDLNNLITNQSIKLNDILNYKKTIEVKDFNFTSLNTTVDIVSDQNEYTCKVFIPYTGSDNITLTDTISGKSFMIDTSKNQDNIDSIQNKNTSNEINTSDYNLTVSSSYISDMMTRNGESYNSSMLCIYTFNIKVVSITDGIKVTSASYTKNSDGENYGALDDTFNSVKINNILNKTLSVGDEYALFFQVYSNPDEVQDFTGKLTLNFSDGSSTTIDTVLN